MNTNTRQSLEDMLNACQYVLESFAGLNRCAKSCRLRWLNYLRPGIKRGNITEEEEELIVRLHNLLGNRYIMVYIFFKNLYDDF